MYTPRKQSKKHGSVSAAKLHRSRCSIRGAPPVKVGEGLADGVAVTGVSADRSVVDVQTSIDQGGDDGGKSGGDVVVEAPVVFMDDNAQYGVRKDSTEVAGKPQEVSVHAINSYSHLTITLPKIALHLSLCVALEDIDHIMVSEALYAQKTRHSFIYRRSHERTCSTSSRTLLQ